MSCRQLCVYVGRSWLCGCDTRDVCLWSYTCLCLGNLCWYPRQHGLPGGGVSRGILHKRTHVRKYNVDLVTFTTCTCTVCSKVHVLYTCAYNMTEYCQNSSLKEICTLLWNTCTCMFLWHPFHHIHTCTNSSAWTGNSYLLHLYSVIKYM